MIPVGADAKKNKQSINNLLGHNGAIAIQYIVSYGIYIYYIVLYIASHATGTSTRKVSCVYEQIVAIFQFSEATRAMALTFSCDSNHDYEALAASLEDLTEDELDTEELLARLRLEEEPSAPDGFTWDDASNDRRAEEDPMLQTSDTDSDVITIRSESDAEEDMVMIEEDLGSHVESHAEPTVMPPTKRRRLRRKTSIPPIPQSSMQHFADERNLPLQALAKLLRMGFPMVLFNLLLVLNNVVPHMEQSLDMVEYYSGVGAIADAFRSHGYSSAEWDIKYSSTMHNACEPEGMANQLLLAQQLKVGGLAHWATVCSTWVFVSRSSTGRSMTSPEGNEKQECVRIGNCQCARMCLTIMLLIACNKHWIVEQSGTSLMRHSMWVRHIRSHAKTFLSRSWMGMFGGATQKAVELLSGSEWSCSLYRKRDVSRDSQWKATNGVQHESPDSTGRVRVTGHNGLKDSQAYPPGYGLAVLHSYEEGRNAGIDMDMADGIMDGPLDWSEWQAAVASSRVDWSAAALHEVAAFYDIDLHKPMRSM